MTDEQRGVANLLAKQKEYFTHITPIGEVNETKLICLDLETTGVDDRVDEVLEITILDGDMNVLLNTYVKPNFTTSWKCAEAVHHISYEKVKNKPTLQQLAPLIKGIFENADVIVGYNGSFDLGFLDGLYSLENKQVIDVMKLFAPIYGEFSEKYDDYKWQKLQKCADYFGYEFKSHDSYEDAKATLFCYRKIMERKGVSV
ncbi:3'-5' exonuclease [[Clostridium] innocuum]|nr:3'-5' exonuclease [[Clostridium] innocuum]